MNPVYTHLHRYDLLPGFSLLFTLYSHVALATKRYVVSHISNRVTLPATGAWPPGIRAAMEQSLNRFVNNPAYHDVLAIVKGALLNDPPANCMCRLLIDCNRSALAQTPLCMRLRYTGARNGLVYGAKVRFPHALVMTLLFHSGR